MIRIQNEEAAAEARRLSRELIETAIGAFAGLPVGVELRRLLAGVNIDLREAKADSGSFRWNQPHETVEISFAASETAGAEHAEAIRALTRIRTAELADGLNADAVAQVREILRNELAAEHARVSRPLRMGWLLRGAEDRRQAQRDALMQRALGTLSGVPLSSAVFDEVLASVLKLTGSTSVEHADTDALKWQALSRIREFQTRRETVLVLAWEAIATDDGGADIELGTANRSGRFARAKARARAFENKAKEERIRAAEEKRNEALRKKRAHIVREQERRREWEEKSRPRWSAREPEADDGYEFDG